MKPYTTIQQQYDNLIALHYDHDPEKIIAQCCARALNNLQRADILNTHTPLRTLDIGVGTGSFLNQLMAQHPGTIMPFGLDISEKMIEIARSKIANLSTVVDTAHNVDQHFTEHTFDLICTHLITAYIPIEILAPKVWSRLKPGGYWSFIGSTMMTLPALKAIQTSPKYQLFSLLSRTPQPNLNDLFETPKDHDQVINTFQDNGFEICASETFEPKIKFTNLEQFLDFGYRGGWLTALIEALGLHIESKLRTLIMNQLFFPISDHVSIEICLVQKR